MAGESVAQKAGGFLSGLTSFYKAVAPLAVAALGIGLALHSGGIGLTDIFSEAASGYKGLFTSAPAPVVNPVATGVLPGITAAPALT